MLTKKCKRLIIVLAILLTNHFVSFGQEREADTNKRADSIAVSKTTNNFLISFRNLEWDAFAANFADDMTAFFPPSSRYPYRANNKMEAMNIFKKVFENAHKGKTSPPYLDIFPDDIKIQVSGKTAIVTFTLKDPDLLSRRTLIWEKRNGKWLIIHLHASGMPFPS